MAYGLKYISTAYGLSSSQWKVEIYEKDFIPIDGILPISLSLVGDGIKIGYDREEDRFNTVYSRYAIIDLKVTSSFSLDTLQFDDERKFLIKIYRGNNIEFVGWQIPFFSSQAYEDVSISTISIQAKDGINQLKSIDFADEFPLEFSHKQTVLSVISQCLRKLDYNLDLEVYYNKYEDGMFKTALDCPLSQLFINIKSLKDSDKWQDNFEVIKTLLSDHDLRIFQANGKWIIISPIEIIDGSVTGRRYNYLGEKQVPSVTLSSDLVIGIGGLKIKSNSIVRKGIPIQSFVANFEFGQSRNLVVNGEFQNIVDYEPEGWTLSNNWENDEVTENAGGGIVFQNTYATRSIGINPDVPINDASLTQNKYLESSQINIETLGTFSLSSEIFTNAEIDAVRVRVQFYNEGNTNEMYVTNDGKLTFVPTSIYMYNSQVDSFKMLTLTWNNLNEYGTPIAFKYMRVRIYEGIRLRAGIPSSSEIKYKSIKVAGRPLNVVGEFIGKRVEVKNTLLPTSKKYDDILFTYKDVESFAKDPEHVHKMYLSDVVGETNATTGKWKRTTEANEYPLIESRLIDRLSQTTRFGDIFEGSIFGYVSLEKTPYINTSEKRFLLLYCEYNVQGNSTEIVAVELYANNFSISTKVSNVFSDGTVIDVENDEFTTKIDVGEQFDEITSAGGTTYGGLYTDRGIDSLPANSTDPRATNKGTLLLGPVNAQYIELGNRANDTLVEILGRFGIRNPSNFLGQFSVADLTGNRVATLPDRDIEINKWADLSGVPISFTPSAHFHQIGDVIGLSEALAGKQPLNANLTSLGLINANGIVRRTGANTFGIGTNDPITLTGDVTGTGTTAITTTLSATGVVAGTYRSVTVDAKGRVTAGSVPNYNTEWDARWNTKIADFIEFGSDIQINGGLGVIGNIFLGGNFFDKDSSTGTENQVLMPVSGGGVAWTSLSTAQISNFSANVLGQLLTDLGTGSNTPITSSNTIKTGLQNLQAQVSAKANAFVGTTNYLTKFASATGLGNSIVYENSGKIGISTTTADRKLVVNGQIGFSYPDGNSYVGLSSTSDNLGVQFFAGVTSSETNNSYRFSNHAGENIFVIQNGGAIGVRTNAPLASLHVKAIDGRVAVFQSAKGSGNNYIEFISSGGASQGYIGFGRAINDFLFYNPNTTNYEFYNGGILSFILYGNNTAKFTGQVQFDSIPTCSVAPTAANHLTNKAYVDSLASIKRGDTVKTISLTTLTKSGLYAVNGYTLLDGDLVLDAGGTSGGGVWVAASGAWSRSTTNDTDSEIRGAYHLITNGTYANSRYINTNTSSITLDTTAITYDVDFGAETDPVWTAYKTANDLTPTRFGNWNTAFSWGNHTNLYVDKVSTQSDIAGAKKFTTSIQSPVVKGGTDSLGISIFNHFGTAPRIGSSGTMDFFATTDYTWYTTGDFGRMRLTASGLRVGSSSAPNFTLQVSGTTGLGGLLSVVSPFTGVYSSGTDGQFLQRKSVAGLNYNQWASLLVADVSDIATYYQAKITGTENYLTKKTATNFGDSQIFDDGTFLAIGGTTAIDGSKFSVVGKIGANTARIGDDTNGINIGSLAINSTGALNYGATSHVWNVSATEKMNLNDSRLALTGNFELTGKLKVNGTFGLDHYFLKTLGVDGGGVPLGTEWAVLNCGEISDIADLYVSKTFADANYIKRVLDEGERGFFLYGDANNTIKEGFMFTNPDTGIMGIHAYRLTGSTVEQYGFQLDKDGLPYWLFADGSRKRILTTNDAVGGGGTPLTYTLAEPLYFIGSQINVRTASSTQTGVLTNTKFGEFDAKLGQGSTVNTYLNFADNKRLYFGYTSQSVYDATIYHNRNNMSLNLQTADSHLYLTTYGVGKDIGIYSDDGDVIISGKKYFLRKGTDTIEIDMSAFGTGKVLKATSNIKAEWVTP